MPHFVLDWQTTGATMKRIVFALFLVLTSVIANGADAPKSSVFIKPRCESKVSSAVLAFLKTELESAPKFHIVPNLTDEGRMGEVLTIDIVCAERTDIGIAGVATTFGKGKCFPGAYCHGVMDGSSLMSTLCDMAASPACGKVIFKAFDEYVSHMASPGAPQLQLH